MTPRRAHPTQAAYTLAEVLVASALLLVVQGIAYLLLVLSNRSWSVVATRADVAINAQVGVAAMRRELQDTTASSVTVGTNAVAFLSALDDGGVFQTDADGQPLWQAFVVYYVDPNNSALRRSRITPASATPLSQAQVAALCDGRGTVIAYDVAALCLTSKGAQVTLSVTARATMLTGRVSLTPSMVFLLRN